MPLLYLNRAICLYTLPGELDHPDNWRFQNTEAIIHVSQDGLMCSKFGKVGWVMQKFPDGFAPNLSQVANLRTPISHFMSGLLDESHDANGKCSAAARAMKEWRR